MANKSSRSSSSYNLSALPVIIFAHLLVITITTLVLVWLLQFREGVAFKSDNKQKIFNVHPLLMVIGFILLTGEGIMVYKTLPAKRETQKVAHLVIQLIALIAGIIGIYAVFKFHHERRIPNMYTLHSWFGMSTICLFGLQWVLAFLMFMFPGSKSFTRAKVAPWHVFLGVIIFFMAILSAETGLVERFVILGLRRTQEALIVNFTGLLILLLAVAVGFTVILP